MNIRRQTGAAVRREVERFYGSVGYTGGIRDRDVVFVERRDGEVAGAVRLCLEEGILVLRGLYVAAALRGTGIGTRLLETASEAIGGRECWCIPFRYLTGFYSSAGFTDCPASEAPPFLLERHRGYIARGMPVVIMKRSAAT